MAGFAQPIPLPASPLKGEVRYCTEGGEGCGAHPPSNLPLEG